MKQTGLLTTLLLLILVLLPGHAGAVATAGDIIAKCADRVAKAPSLTLKFTLNYGDNATPCDIIISKDKYRLSSPEMEVWYDGTTQWTYAVSQKELSITEPTAEELMESNPFAILNHYAKAYNCRRLSGTAPVIEMTSKAAGATIRKAVVTVNPKTYMPEKLVVTLSNGRTFTATVGTVATGKALPTSTFVYDAKRFPAAVTADLR